MLDQKQMESEKQSPEIVHLQNKLTEIQITYTDMKASQKHWETQYQQLEKKMENQTELNSKFNHSTPNPTTLLNWAST